MKTRLNTNYADTLRTIKDHLSNESDIGAALITTSLLDEQLKSLLLTYLRKGSTADNLLNPTKGILGTYNSKCDLVYCLNLIEKDVYNDLRILGEIEE